MKMVNIPPGEPLEQLLPGGSAVSGLLAGHIHGGALVQESPDRSAVAAKRRRVLRKRILLVDDQRLGAATRSTSC